MRNALSAAALLALALGGALQAAPAQAQASRTWVSGVGNDGNACSRSAPCKTFGGALAKTAAGGEINCLGSGDYGPLTITVALTIDCDAGTAAITANTANSAFGVIVAAGASDAVVLRGLDIEGGNVGDQGIQFQRGLSLHVEHCRIRGFGLGISFNSLGFSTSTLVVQHSTLTENGTGISIDAGAFAVVAALDHVRITRGGGVGVSVLGDIGSSTVSIADSTISENAGSGVVAVSGGANASVRIARSVIASNGALGVQSNQSNGGVAAVTLQGSQLNDNANGNVSFVGGGTLLTFGDNSLVGAQGTGFSGPIARQ